MCFLQKCGAGSKSVTVCSLTLATCMRQLMSNAILCEENRGAETKMAISCRALKNLLKLMCFLVVGVILSTMLLTENFEEADKHNIPRHIENENPDIPSKDDDFVFKKSSSSSADANINEIIKAKKRATLQNNPVLIQTEDGFIVKTLDDNNQVPSPKPLPQPADTPKDTFSNAFQFQSPLSRGKLMNVSKQMLTQHRLPPAKFTDPSKMDVDNFVFAVAGDENSFKHTHGAVASIQKHFPNHKIVYVDLGLSRNNAAKIQCWSNVIHRKLAFDKFPPHVKDLTIYAWRPLATMDILNHFPAVLWVEGSFRLETPKLDTAFEKARENGGLVLFHASGHSIFSGTHPNTYDYFPVKQDQLKKIRMWSASILLVFNTREMYETVLHWWYMCALDQACISPSGITRPCWPLIQGLGLHHFDTYFKYCHRFEISVLNILLASKYEYMPFSYIATNAESFFKGRRTSSMSTADPKTQPCFD